MAYLLSGKAHFCEEVSGQAFFITDDNPVNNLKFFLEPMLQLLGKNPELPKMKIPVGLTGF